MERNARTRASRIGVVAAIVAAVGLIAACGSSHNKSTSVASAATSSSCHGTPIVLETITNISAPVGQEAPEFPAGATAAANAVTKSCELGAPVKIVSCDDQFNPNGDAKCGREAVTNKALAVVAYSGFGDSYGTIATRSGIPILPANATSSTESTSKLSYPFGYPITSLIGQINLAASTGGKKLALFVLAIPSVQFFVGVAKMEAAALGMKVVSTVSVPPTATDMSSYVAQAISSGADSFIPILGTAQQEAALKGLAQQGVNFTKSHVVTSLLTVTPTALKALGKGASGLLLNTWAWNPTDTSKPYIQQYLGELAAAGQPHGPLNVDMLGVTGWAEVHVLADALKAAKLAPTPANVPKALTSPGVTALTVKYGLSPVDFTKPAFPAPKALASLRLFSPYNTDWEVNSAGVPEPLSQQQLNVAVKTPLKRLGS